MNNFDFSRILKAFTNFATNEGFYPKKPIGLLSPIFPNEFNVSAGHDFSFEIFKNPSPLDTSVNFSLIDTCFRRIDIDRVGYSNHLSLFHIALFGYANATAKINNSIPKAVEQFVRFLTEVLGVPVDRLLITTFGGWKEKNLTSENSIDLINAWRGTGVPGNSLLIINGRRNFFLSQGSVCAGPTCEVYYDRGKETDNFGMPRYIEIGSINWYRYINNARSPLDEPINSILLWGIGIERTLMAVNNTPSIFHIDCMLPLLEIVAKGLKYTVNESNLYAPSVRTIIDNIRSSTFICSEGIKADSTPRGRILKKLIKNFTTQLKYLDLNNSLYTKVIVKKILELYRGYYPKLEINKMEILSIMEDELR